MKRGLLFLFFVAFLPCVTKAQRSNCISIDAWISGDAVTSPSFWIASQTITYTVQCFNDSTGKVQSTLMDPLTGTGQGTYRTNADGSLQAQVPCNPRFFTSYLDDSNGAYTTSSWFEQDVLYGTAINGYTPNAACKYKDPLTQGFDGHNRVYCGLSGCPGPKATPVVVDVTGEGFLHAFTGYANGVMFDIEGTGTPMKIGWVKANSGVAFLARPGSDGLVHNGKQLFGNFTPQPPPPPPFVDEPNGFNALRPCDLNHDGVIDDQEAAACGIVFWWDRNGDGICTKDEIYNWVQLHLTSISLNYHKDNFVDPLGDLFGFRTTVTGEQDRTAYDVILPTCPSLPVRNK